MGRPHVIHHVMESLSEGDGVTNLALRTGRMLSELGERGTILTGFAPPSLAEQTLPSHDVLGCPDGALLYHYWNYNTSSWIVHAVHGRKAIYYHNITPPRFFPSGSSLRQMTTAGYAQIRQLVDCFDLMVGSSRYNTAELCRFLHRPTPALHLYPIIEPAECHSAPVDGMLLTRLRSSGEINLLFVGRVVPNKRQDLLLGLFARYHRLNPRSRLFLVGSELADPEYRAELERLRLTLPCAGHIVFTGKVSDASLNAYMRAADVFVCASEHEGFCIPVAVAMALDVPVVARAEAAVPETLGDGGVLVREWDEMRVVEVVQRLVTDRALRGRVIRGQRAALARFSASEVRERLAAIVAFLRSGTWSPLFTWSHDLVSGKDGWHAGPTA